MQLKMETFVVNNSEILFRNGPHSICLIYSMWTQRSRPSEALARLAVIRECWTLGTNCAHSSSKTLLVSCGLLKCFYFCYLLYLVSGMYALLAVKISL